MNHVVFFDGVCNLCSESIQFIIKNDRNNVFKFSSLQSEFAQKTLSNKNIKEISTSRTIILLSNNNTYAKSGAVLRIARLLRFPLNLLYIFIIVPPFIRNAVYDYISNNRYRWFGKKQECWIPNETLKSKFIH
jgi:predicted DCC family thiol-disulfide oxidoreductase YuxK